MNNFNLTQEKKDNIRFERKREIAHSFGIIL